jgi:hypothetical protein
MSCDIVWLLDGGDLGDLENPNLDSVSEPWVFGLNLQNEAVVITMARH